MSVSESGYSVMRADGDFYWFPGADQYVVTSHGHIQIRQGSKSIAEVKTWEVVRWHDNVIEYKSRIEDRKRRARTAA